MEREGPDCITRSARSSEIDSDHSAVAVVEKRDGEAYLAFLKQFRLGTEYGSVMGYLRLLNEKLGDLRRIPIDQTDVGEVFVEDAVKSGLKNARGLCCRCQGSRRLWST